MEAKELNSYRLVTDDLYWVGVDDHRLALFENMHPIQEGVSYNSYMLLDEKTVLLDTVDWSMGQDFFDNVESLLNGRKLDYIIVNHMEPDHAATLGEMMLHHPEATIVSNAKAVQFMKQFGFAVEGKTQVIKEGDILDTGSHKLTFVMAPMVHWPEAMVTYDTTNGALFSADAFGTFGALNGRLFNDELLFDRDWLDEARRYYTNIVGKYGNNTQKLLKKAAGLDIKFICPLHGPVWRSDFNYFIDKYDLWSRYEPEKEGVMIVYGSMYGHTEAAVAELAAKLSAKGMNHMKVFDVSKQHVSYLIANAFKYSHIVLASVTYNLGIFPPMAAFLDDMKALNLQNRKVSIIENGTWAIKSGDKMQEKIDSMKNMTLVGDRVTIQSAMTAENEAQLDALADAIIASMK
ncbi:MAG: FprA family A-type flavoprotein [Lachnospiraceae bacterium]|jgi:flavorubredoxin|nr:FprA family A-type flavoprotein [Lachnospiraceae bacterium]MCI1658009.1 FprA family A-type flavoprotein [Lachnospiraceae bacterium]MCI2196373.1 FprA family A-type flavoprotein [Lachnospiraceae bacterium]